MWGHLDTGTRILWKFRKAALYLVHFKNKAEINQNVKWKYLSLLTFTNYVCAYSTSEWSL